MAGGDGIVAVLTSALQYLIYGSDSRQGPCHTELIQKVVDQTSMNSHDMIRKRQRQLSPRCPSTQANKKVSSTEYKAMWQTYMDTVSVSENRAREMAAIFKLGRKCFSIRWFESFDSRKPPKT